MQQSKTRMEIAQAALQYAAPVAVLLYYLLASAVSVCTLQNGRQRSQSRSWRAITYGIYFVLATYAVQTGLLIFDSLSTTPRISSVAANVHAISFFLLWSTQAIILHRTRRPIWYLFYGSWLITLAFETVIFSLFASQHTVWSAAGLVLVIIKASQVTALLGLLARYVTLRINIRQLWSDEESASLLGRKTVPSSRQNSTIKSPGHYGSTVVTTAAHSSSADTEDSELEDQVDRESKKKQRSVTERLEKDGNWFTYLRGFSIFIPMAWPSKQPALYFNIVGCGLCLLCERVMTVLQPRQLGIIVNILTTGSGPLYKAIGLYFLFHWASSSAGIDVLRAWLWIPIEQYSYTRMTTAAYNQVMGLSRDFHDNKQSGELFQSIIQGQRVIDLMENVIFGFVPMIIDVMVGFLYLYSLFGPYVALLAVATTIAYLSTTTRLNISQSSIRRELQDLDRKQSQIMYDTVGSWATVSYFNRVSYEKSRFERAVTLQGLVLLLYLRLGRLFRAVTNFIMEVGLLGALLLAAYQVSHGARGVGDFVTLLTYWSVFTGPVAYFAHAQKYILSLLVDAEALLQLFRQEPKVKDGANEFRLKKGAVQFNDVQFSYDDSKQIIKGLNLIVQPGQKIAFVGETGGGKSTLLKLLFRFYDVTKGSLLVDGQDVRDVTLESLRRCMGVVPQDPSMFNDTVMNNVRYSKLDATDEEVMEACKAAAIHDKVLSFTEGYSTIVGEKGVKLSGGELQRLAIARAILKDPSIILLDEATSSVDTDTESRIQSALSELTKGRTTFTVAHRLSTVIDADTILVIKDGAILEQGSPKELLAAKGRYYDLWCKQVGITSKTAEKTANEATHDVHESLENEQARPGSSEYRKGWRPDAPEFVPRHLQSRPDTNNDRKKTQGSDDVKVNPFKQDSGEQSTVFNKAPSEGKQRADDDADKTAVSTRTDAAADNRGEDTHHGNDELINDSDGDHKRTRLSRARRRKMSKSEPTGSSMSAGEGAFELDKALEGSGEGPSTERRRVSAPSKPPSSEAGKLAGQGRRNRRKHWRMRQQSSSHAPSESQPVRVSGALSTQSSVPTPSVPTTTPAQTNGDGKDHIVGKGNVRFSRDA
ncbi:MAG: hypothetical protein LQ343_005648 [Gyalolechia ehrenbergii]|nr:MAG: hypothetical protein LQ343_005648 [Gyalolechia ehrenbergii]